jgi:hypothetical protein
MIQGLISVNMKSLHKNVSTILLIFLFLCIGYNAFCQIQWIRKSSSNGDIEPPNKGNQQTCLVVGDFDGDGVNDFVVGERTQAPSVVWYKWNGNTWGKRIIDDGKLQPEAGGVALDVDGDGDLDLILGQDYSGNAIWWWGNPKPDFTKTWKRRFIKNSGGRKHHDQTAGDFDGDGKIEFVSWNQGARQLLFYKIPDNPKQTEPWSSAVIFSWKDGKELEGFPSVPVDIDGDGKLDIVGGGRWFKHTGGDKFAENIIDDSMRFTQCAAGQIVKGGWAEVVFSPGDEDGDVKWYEYRNGIWVPHVLCKIIHGHTCEARDINGDGNLDIIVGEMGSPGAGDKARTIVFWGDGRGNFKETVVSVGQGIHEGQVADVNGDGRLDIIMKPYNHKAPRIDILLSMPEK